MKFKSFLFTLSIAWGPFNGALFAATLTWDNGSSSASWNSMDANWSTLVWNNGTPDNAVFENRNETVFLTEAISAGAIEVRNGGEASGPHLLLFTGAALSAGSIAFNGSGLGGTVDSIYPPNANPAANQSLVFEGMSVSINSNIEIGRGTLEISGNSSVSVTGGIYVLPGQAWQNLRLRDTASLVVGAGVDLRWVGSNVSLEGGTLTTPFLWGNATTFNGGTGLLIDGAKLVPMADEADFLRVSADTDAASHSGKVTIGAGGATFDTNGFTIGVSTPMTGSGGMIKSGTGALVLNAANSYQGNTWIDAGSLAVSSSGSLTSYVVGHSANIVGGTAAVNIDGSLVINTTSADLTDNNSWLLVDVGNLTETYGAGFNVPGFTESTPGVWSRTEGANTWTFSESTGTLVLDINQGIATYVLETRGAGPAGNVQTVWTSNGTAELPTGPGGNHRLNEWAVIDANNRLLMSFDFSSIIEQAAGRDIVVRYVKLDAVRSGWATGWASTSLFTAAPFEPSTTTWDSSAFIQNAYIGDIGGGGVFTMTWDSRYPGTDPWNSEFDELVTDVQSDIDNDRTSDYLMRVNVGNEWSATIGTDVLRMTLEVEFVGTVSPFSTWMAGYPSVPVDARGPGDDPDGDGASNLAEFGFKGNPSDASDIGLSSILLQDSVPPAGNELTLVIAVRDGASFAAGAAGVQSATISADQISYTIEGSTDLLFPSASVSQVSVSNTAPGLPDLTGSEWEYQTFRLDASEGLNGKGFLRAKISNP